MHLQTNGKTTPLSYDATIDKTLTDTDTSELWYKLLVARFTRAAVLVARPHRAFQALPCLAAIFLCLSTLSALPC